ncbi:MAG: FimB/Mfa2 family fimbrial subunit [Dysgonomonas sp.]
MKNLRIKVLMTVLTLGSLFWGCDSLIYKNLADCPQGVYVKFFSLTPCAVDSMFIGDVSSLTVFAFDEEGKLVTSVNQQNVTLNRDFEILVPVSNGNFSFIAWAGVNENFTRSTFSSGVTTKKDVMLAIKSTNSKATSLGRTERIWQGESSTIFLPDPEESGSLYKHTAVNLHELTNRVKVIVEFDASITELTPKDLSVSISSANGIINIDGSMPFNSPIIFYPEQNTVYTDNSVTWDFSMLELITGYHNNLNISYPKTGQQVFNGDLIGSILMNTVSGGVNLNCVNDFTIKFLLKDYCAECGTHFSCAVYVNDWLVHSYSTDL